MVAEVFGVHQKLSDWKLIIFFGNLGTSVQKVSKLAKSSFLDFVQNSKFLQKPLVFKLLSNSNFLFYMGVVWLGVFIMTRSIIFM